MIKDITTQYNAKKIEKEIQNFWKKEKLYEYVRNLRKNGRKFYFVDGPPYTTGRIHLGTARNKIIKDSILRYKSMNHFRVEDRAGWDMHGLPIEVKVEGELNFKSKKDIEKYGIDKFVEHCKKFALLHKDEMTLQFQNLGIWLNWEDPYMTLRDEYIEAAWWTLKRAQEKNLLEKGLRVVNWCPRCETAIADAEVEYWDETDPSIFVKFPVKSAENTYIVVWTTTPWTIPSNIAVAVHPSFEYSKVRAWKDGKEDLLIVASELVEKVLKKGKYHGYENLEKMLGEDLVGLSYDHPLKDIVPIQEYYDHKVHKADFVTTENTGCVHIAPGHGVEDFQLGIENNLPIFCPVGADGRYTEEIGEKYKNKYVKSADLEIITDLKEKGLVLASGEIVHRYGHCWRCKTPIIYLATKQWFLKVSEIKNDMLAEIDRVQWYPQWAGYSRFYDWISNARDWCISRQRYWGIPLPIWICKECKKIEVIGTVKELEQKIGENYTLNLHRPYVDEIKLKCNCGGSMERVSDVFDVWFDSAVASWATLNYPRDSERFEELWPADFITEGHDQTRGWFYSQLGASMIAFDRAPYKSVLMHGFTLDEQGRKMSKSIGNVVNPEDVIEKYGADTLRLYVLSQSAPWEDLKFNWDEVATIFKSLNIFLNVYRFPLLYMESDNFDPSITILAHVRSHLRIEDVFILSRVNLLISEVNSAMSDYQLHKAVRSILNFIVNDLSRWYLQIIRRRLWNEYISMDKLSAYRTFYEVLMTTAKLLAPYAPFITESMYQNLRTSQDPLTIHGCDYPEVNKELINKELEEQVLISRSIEEASANARQKVKRKLRWPVKRIIIKTEDEKIKKAIYALENLIKDRTNSKAILVVSEWEELEYEVIPQMSVIGPAFTKSAGKVMKALKSRDINGKELKKALARDGVYKLREYEITYEMVEFKEKLPEDVASSEFTGGIVYVDAKLTPEIEAEGYAREVIRRIQDMRKDLDLDVEEKIYISLDIADERIKALIESWMDYILSEVQGIECVEMAKDLIKEWDVDGVKMNIGIERTVRG